jgi:phosphoribosylanthranilate isomerase
MMTRTIVQLYEIQEPREAEKLIELGVDHIGSVILSAESWKSPDIRDVCRLVRQSPAKSSLIPLFTKVDDILRVLDYYEPALVHFCELIPLSPGESARREACIAELIRTQERVRKEFPPVGIIRSIPVPAKAPADPAPVREAIRQIVRMLGPHSELFMTDTLRGFEEAGAVQPVEGYVGITGETCDWDLAAALIEASPIPVLLAGGIGPENAFDAIRRLRPAGIDSCTRTNPRDGWGKPIRFKKDMDLVRRLIDEARRADEEL